MGLRTRILRHPALREFYRNYRVLLTFRGFLLAAAATTLYLLIANTLGLEQLQELEQVQDERDDRRRAGTGSGDTAAAAAARIERHLAPPQPRERALREEARRRDADPEERARGSREADACADCRGGSNVD